MKIIFHVADDLISTNVVHKVVCAHLASLVRVIKNLVERFHAIAVTIRYFRQMNPER